jgi:hypothetical protein
VEIKIYLDKNANTFCQLGDARVLVIVLNCQKVCSYHAASLHCTCPGVLEKANDVLNSGLGIFPTIYYICF